MRINAFTKGMVVRHNNVVGTIKDICGNYVEFTNGYVCHIDYIEEYKCSENEYNRVCGAIHGAFGKQDLYSILCDFGCFNTLMESLGYKYICGNNERECHIFRNEKEGFELDLFPVCYYKKQGIFRVYNIQII